MERIRDAVEQARRQREAASGKAPDAAANSAAQPAATDAGVSADETVGSPAKNIVYTKTREVIVSPSVREKNRLVAAIPNHPLMDCYRMLRTRVLQEMEANNWKVLAVTSPATGSGKSLTAINLAISIGRDLSHTCLLVDGDLRRPSVAEYFGYSPEFGMNDYIFNDVPLEDVLFRPDMDRLTILPGREPISESAEVLASAKMRSTMTEMRDRYDDRIIIVDMAPVLSVDDALAARPNIDCVLMVAESGETKHADLSEAIELLQSNKPIIGTVLNKVDKKVTEAY
jgi:protein-tyrosine kinase